METNTATYYKIKKVMDQYNIPDWIWLPIAQLESGLNSLATNITDKEYSMGIFQINVKAHPEYSSLNLFDPEENARAIADLWQGRGVIEKAQELPIEQQAAYVWRYGSRPAWNTDIEKKVTDLSLEVLQDSSSYDSAYDSDFWKEKILEDAGEKNSPADAPSLGLKGIIIRGVAYGLIFIFIFVAILFLAAPKSLDVMKGVKKIAE